MLPQSAVLHASAHVEGSTENALGVGGEGRSLRRRVRQAAAGLGLQSKDHAGGKARATAERRGCPEV